jgi:predicted TIM-barrel fold metal-dependent hydrolase
VRTTGSCSTDYPHWDYDDPQRALPDGMPPELRRKILAGNAKRLYGLA